MHYQFSCALKLARKYEIEHWSRSSKAINWSADSFQKTRHVDELTHEPAIWSCDTGQWLSCFDSCQLTILWMSNVHDVDLPRHAWDTPPSLLIISSTLPLDAYVRTYVRSVNHVTTKWKEVDHIPWVWGSVPRALRACGSSAIKRRLLFSFWVRFLFFLSRFVFLNNLYFNVVPRFSLAPQGRVGENPGNEAAFI